MFNVFQFLTMFKKIAKHRANDASLTMHRTPLDSLGQEHSTTSSTRARQSLASSPPNNKRLSDIKPYHGWGFGGKQSSRACQREGCCTRPSNLQERGRRGHGQVAELLGGGGGLCRAVGRHWDDPLDALQLERTRWCDKVNIQRKRRNGVKSFSQVLAEAGRRSQRWSTWARIHMFAFRGTRRWK